MNSSNLEVHRSSCKITTVNSSNLEVHRPSCNITTKITIMNSSNLA